MKIICYKVRYRYAREAKKCRIKVGVILLPFRAAPNQNYLSLWQHRFSCVTAAKTVEAVSEKPCQRISNADRRVFANPESFCNKLIIG